ncbi:hypothetical protein [Lysobacter humi (ex Lee et al. 2017)]
MKRVLAVAILATSPLAAAAGELRHTYVEGGISRFHEEVPSVFGRDLDYDGGYVRGSVGIGESWYAFGSLHRGSDDDGGLFFEDRTETTLGIGYAHALGGRTELIAELGGERRDLDWTDVDGARASTGVRAALGTRMEGWAKATYSDLDHGYSRFSGQAGALFKIDDTWGFTGDVDVRDEGTRYSLGVRASF